MHRPSRRGAVAIAVLASLGTGSVLASTAPAAEPAAQPRLLLPILGDVPLPLDAAALQPILDTVANLAPAQLDQLLAGLTPAEIGSLLAGGSVEQLTALLAGLTPEQLQAAMATMTPAQQQQAAGNIAAAQAAAAAKPKTPAATAAAAAKAFSGYRASLGSVSVARNRKSVRFKVSCPVTAPKGCITRVSGLVAGRKAMAAKDVLLIKGTSETVRVSLSSAAAKRLKAKGGSLKLTARTALSSLPSATKTTKVKAPARPKPKK